jgi:hypothetical protein
MVNHVSASMREDTPDATETTQTTTISAALRRRAQAVINDTSIDPQWRNIVRYALEINDPLLPDLVRRAAGESIIDNTDFSQTPEIDEDHSTRDKLEALVDIICGTGGAQAAGALFVLMGTLQNSTEPEGLAHTAKHFAFTRCGELNLNGMVDAQLAVVESELLAGTTLR